MNKKLKNELLHNYLVEINLDSTYPLLVAFEDTFKSYSVENIYDLFWDIRKRDKHHSDLETYYKFKLKLLQLFIDKFEYPDEASAYFVRHSDLRNFTVDSIIEMIVDKNSIHKELESILNNYCNIDRSVRKIIEKYFSGLVKEIKKPSKEQITLIKHILAIYSKKSYQIQYNNETGIDKSVKMQFRIIPSNMPHNLEVELMLRLYLHGDKDVPPSSYYDYWYSYNHEKEDILFVFDRFTIWLWKWAKKQKPSNNIVPEKLKVFCTQLMQLSCKYNSATKYTTKDFRTNNQENTDNAWIKFKIANSSAKTRLIE